jgi:hypothetical protein
MLRGCGIGLLFVVAGLACTHPGQPIGHVWPVSGPCEANESGVVLCGGAQVAQIECLPGPVQPCRALSVRYARDGVVVWIHGDEKSARITGRRNVKLDWDWASRVIVARDGSAVWFWGRGVFESTDGTWRRYDLMNDQQSTVDSKDVWKLWALLQEGNAVWLGGPQPGLSVVHW